MGHDALREAPPLPAGAAAPEAQALSLHGTDLAPNQNPLRSWLFNVGAERLAR